MKKCFKNMRAVTLLMAFMCLFSFVSFAEGATLKYSYGDEAYNKHMLDIRNTIVYKGEKWTFEQGAFSFEGAFMMYGGNTRTVFECEVPEFRRLGAPEGEKMYLGKAEICPPEKMDLYVFSGDRTTGEYILTDSQSNIGSYTLDIYAARAGDGTFRLTDKVFLYSYEQNGQRKNYAASLYISFENYKAAPADTEPENAVIQEMVSGGNNVKTQADNEKLENYAQMIAILEAENRMLTEEIAVLKAQGSAASAEEIEQLKGENTALYGEVEACHAVITEMDQEIIRLNEEIAEAQSMAEKIQELETAAAEQAAKNAELNQVIDDLNGRLEGHADMLNRLNNDCQALAIENVSLAAENEESKALIESLQAENEQLKAEAEKGAHLITDSDTEISALGKADEAASVKETPDSKASVKSENPVSGKSISVRPDAEKPAAELSVTATPETVYPARSEEKDADWFGWNVTFSIENVSNVPVTPECAIVVFYNGEAETERVVLAYEDMRPNMGNDAFVKGNDPFEWGFGWTDNNSTHVTFVIRGTDANGHEVEAEATAVIMEDADEEIQAAEETEIVDTSEEAEETAAITENVDEVIQTAEETETVDASDEAEETNEISEEEMPCDQCVDGQISCTVSGYTVCPSCRKVTDGYYDTCDFCGGAGVTKCTACSGSGRKTCPNCKGYPITNPQTKEEAIKKADCSIFGCRNGYVDCRACDGGYSICFFCYGSGDSFMKTPYCEKCDVKVVCGGCFGVDHQSFPCPNCMDEVISDFVYRDVMRNPNQFVGTDYRLTGTVGAVERKAEGLYTFRLYQDDGGVTRTVFVQFLQNPNEERLLEGDPVTLYGRFVSVDDQNLPRFVVYSAKVEE